MINSHYDLVKMRFAIPEDEFRGNNAEWLWVSPCGNGLFSVDSIPFEVFGISADDIVSGYIYNGYLNFGKIIHQSGNRTIRLKLFGIEIGELLSELGIGEIEYEGSKLESSPFYSCNIPSSIEYGPIKLILDDLEASGKIEYEEANV